MIIGVIGNYGRSNAGDEAIGASLIEVLLRRYPDAMILVSRPGRYWPEPIGAWRLDPDGVVQRVDGESRVLSRHLGFRWGREFDVLIIGGGGLLMDLHRWAVPKYLQAALIARARGRPVAARRHRCIWCWRCAERRSPHDGARVANAGRFR